MPFSRPAHKSFAAF